MGFSQLGRHIALRVAALCATLLLACVAFVHGQYWALASCLFALALAQAFGLYHCVNRANVQFQQFVTSLIHDDASQAFDTQLAAAGAHELADALRHTTRQLNQQRQQQAGQLRYLEALVANSPVPLLSVHADERLTLHNQAARRLLKYARRAQDLTRFGEDFANALTALQPGTRQLLPFTDGVEQRQLMVQTSQFKQGKAVERLYSLLDIQRELDSAQLQAWQDLVAVLTHEMMNSLTPVTSLAHTARDLVASLGNTPSAADREDLQVAIDTVARRAEGLTQFVQRYRSLSLTPSPTPQPVAVRPLIDRCLAMLAAPERVNVQCLPDNLTLYADPHLLEQVLINLLRNAEQAVQAQADARIELTASGAATGQVNIQIADNGPGIAAADYNAIFLPFFTTKTGGAGIGLALVRQVVSAHGGFVQVGRAALGGALFTLTLPAVKGHMSEL